MVSSNTCSKDYLLVLQIRADNAKIIKEERLVSIEHGSFKTQFSDKSDIFRKLEKKGRKCELNYIQIDPN